MNTKSVWLFSILFCFTAEIALAEPLVELALVVRGRVDPTAPQQWSQVLGAAGFKAGEAVAAEQALPVYLRDKVANKPGVR